MVLQFESQSEECNRPAKYCSISAKTLHSWEYFTLQGKLFTYFFHQAISLYVEKSC